MGRVSYRQGRFDCTRVKYNPNETHLFSAIHRGDIYNIIII